MKSIKDAVRDCLRTEQSVVWPKAFKQFKQIATLTQPSDWVGIYLLFSAGQLVYIGQTKSAMRRMASHQTSKDFDQVMFVRINEEMLDGVEEALICAFKPPLNIAKVNGQWTKEAAWVVLHQAWKASGRKQAIQL